MSSAVVVVDKDTGDFLSLAPLSCLEPEVEIELLSTRWQSSQRVRRIAAVVFIGGADDTCLHSISSQTSMKLSSHHCL